MNKEIAVAPKDLRGMLALPAIRERFENILGNKARAFASSIISVTQGNKALQECDPGSIIASAAMAASLDLPIIGSLGQSCLVPYSGKAQFQIMARGFVQLALRSGQYKTMNAVKVHDGEIVSRNRLTGEIDFNHDGKKSEKIVGFLFYFKLNTGFEKYTYMTVEECQAHGKKYSKSYGRDDSKWKTDFNAMALKTVVKQGLSKWGPLSTEMQKAIQFDQAAVRDDGTPEYIDSTAEAKDDKPAAPIAGPEAKEAEVVPPAEAPTPPAQVITEGESNVTIKSVAKLKRGGFKISGELDYYTPEETFASAAKKLMQSSEEAKIAWKRDASGLYWIVDIGRVSDVF